jgi:hypothetical protein
VYEALGRAEDVFEELLPAGKATAAGAPQP